MRTCSKCYAFDHDYGSCPKLSISERLLYYTSVIGLCALLGLLTFMIYIASTFRWSLK